MKKIGILGGTFNPIHVGHLAIAQFALEKLELNKVIFVPCCQPPHKQIPHLAPAKDRFQMTKLAIEDNPAFDISDFEIKKGGRSYTIDTARYFQKIFPAGTKLYFIIGGDSLGTLRHWKQINELLKIVSFVAVNRPGFRPSRTRIRHQTILMPGIDIASSYLRRRIAQGNSIKYLVVDKVFKYIEKNKLYRYKQHPIHN